MGINLVVAVTDTEWFDTLRTRQPLAEVNFWAPSGTSFRALKPGELFLFKLHAPQNFIVGFGIFAYATILPCSLAWECFGEANGATSLRDMRARIAKYRRADSHDRSDFQVGCRVLTQPLFFREGNFIPVPASWSPNIVSLKTYNTDDADGAALWNAVTRGMEETSSDPVVDAPRYGEPQLVKPRLGQGAFRAVVTDTYGRKCAITQERTLPALEAAHIRPYSEGGPHETTNGLLLRRDIHSLFDSGYVTVSSDLRFEVSRRIKEEFENGKHYYELHGQRIFVPEDLGLRPDPAALSWHREFCFKG